MFMIIKNICNDLISQIVQDLPLAELFEPLVH
jgi:hypothetical protein